MCWEGPLPYCLCQCINHPQLSVIKLCSAFPCTSLQKGNDQSDFAPCSRRCTAGAGSLLLMLLLTTL